MSATWRVDEADALLWLGGLDAESVDAVVTDPPYSSGGTFRGDRTQRSAVEKYVTTENHRDFVDFGGDSRDQRSYLLWSTFWLCAAWHAAKPGAMLAVFTDWRQLPTTTDAIQAGGWVWRGILPWVKPIGYVRPQSGFAYRAEYIVWGTKGSTRLPLSVQGAWEFRPQDEDRSHPTQKPTGLLLDLLKPVVAGGLVLDPFCGSGTTGYAAILTGRRFLGCEQSPHYAEVARERCRAAVDGSTLGERKAGQMALLGG